MRQKTCSVSQRRLHSYTPLDNFGTFSSTCLPTTVATLHALFGPNSVLTLARDFLVKDGYDKDTAFNLSLQEMAGSLEEHGKTLHGYGLPEPTVHGTEVSFEHRRWADLLPSMAENCDVAFSKFNSQQHQIFLDIDHAVVENRPLQAFVDGPAGTGKTFLINACCNRTRTRHKIVLATATSGFAAQLFLGGRTTHATFKVCIHFPTITRPSDFCPGPC